jgi:acyl carrier protein
MDPVEERVKTIISAVIKVPVEALKPETDLKKDHGIDSLLGLQIVARLENEFKIHIPEEEIDCYTSIRSILDVIGRLKA